MRRLHAMAVALALLGLLLPWAHIVTVSAHGASDHGGSQHHAAELADALHGHHHPEGETDHRHSLVAFDLAAQRAKSIDQVGTPVCAQSTATPWASPLADATTRGRGLFDNGQGPPGASFQRAILRV